MGRPAGKSKETAQPQKGSKVPCTATKATQGAAEQAAPKNGNEKSQPSSSKHGWKVPLKARSSAASKDTIASRVVAKGRHGGPVSEPSETNRSKNKRRREREESVADVEDVDEAAPPASKKGRKKAPAAEDAAAPPEQQPKKAITRSNSAPLPPTKSKKPLRRMDSISPPKGAPVSRSLQKASAQQPTKPAKASSSSGTVLKMLCRKPSTIQGWFARGKQSNAKASGASARSVQLAMSSQADKGKVDVTQEQQPSTSTRRLRSKTTLEELAIAAKTPPRPEARDAEPEIVESVNSPSKAERAQKKGRTLVFTAMPATDNKGEPEVFPPPQAYVQQRGRVRVDLATESSAVEMVTGQSASSCSGSVPSRKAIKPRDNQLWSDRHAPTALKYLRPRQSWDRVYRWLQKWADGASPGKSRTPAVLIHGPPGCGKTASVKLLAGKVVGHVLEYSLLDADGKSFLESMARKQSNCHQATGSTVVVFDLPEGVTEQTKQRLAAVVQVAVTPIVIVADEGAVTSVDRLWSPQLCMRLRVQLTEQTVRNMLLAVAQKEGFDSSVETCGAIASACKSDLRRALATAQLLLHQGDAAQLTSFLPGGGDWSAGADLRAGSGTSLERAKLTVEERLDAIAIGDPLVLRHSLFDSYLSNFAGARGCKNKVSAPPASSQCASETVQESDAMQALETAAEQAAALASLDMFVESVGATGWSSEPVLPVMEMNGLLVRLMPDVMGESSGGGRLESTAVAKERPCWANPMTWSRLAVDLELPKEYVHSQLLPWNQRLTTTPNLSEAKFRSWLRKRAKSAFISRSSSPVIASQCAAEAECIGVDSADGGLAALSDSGMDAEEANEARDEEMDERVEATDEATQMELTQEVGLAGVPDEEAAEEVQKQEEDKEEEEEDEEEEADKAAVAQEEGGEEEHPSASSPTREALEQLEEVENSISNAEAPSNAESEAPKEDEEAAPKEDEEAAPEEDEEAAPEEDEEAAPEEDEGAVSMPQVASADSSFSEVGASTSEVDRSETEAARTSLGSEGGELPVGDEEQDPQLHAQLESSE